jgi:hypothetical protein
MRNWPLGLPGRILCEHSPWCQRKLWSYYWHHSSPVSSFFCLGEFGLPFTAHAFFPDRLSNHCQGFCCTLSLIYTKFDAVPSFGSIAEFHYAKYRTPNNGTLIISNSTQQREILYTDPQDMLVLSCTVALRYSNCSTDGSTSSGNYECSLVRVHYNTSHVLASIVRVFRCDSPPMRSRRSTGSGGDSFSMLTSVEGNAVQAFWNEWLITTPLNFHEWTWLTAAQLLQDCHF